MAITEVNLGIVKLPEGYKVGIDGDFMYYHIQYPNGDWSDWAHWNRWEAYRYAKEHSKVKETEQ